MATDAVPLSAPLKDMDEWDDFLTGRYKEGKSQEEFRQYDETATPGVARTTRSTTEPWRSSNQRERFDLPMIN